MQKQKEKISISSWINSIQAKGKISFSLNDLRDALKNNSEASLKIALNRLSKKGNIISVHKGYYVIVPPQYSSRGILPPILYMDGLMKFLHRPYYVGLLNAAAMYGAAHQQPQEFFVVTNLPALRISNKKAIRINYVSINDVNPNLLEERKTESGYVKISSPILTAADLIQFEKRIGGLSRASTILNELAEEINIKNISPEFYNTVPVAVIQRLGYILEHIINKINLAEEIFNQCKKKELPFFRIPLKSGKKTKGYSSENRWNVIANDEIEFEE